MGGEQKDTFAPNSIIGGRAPGLSSKSMPMAIYIGQDGQVTLRGLRHIAKYQL